MSQQMILAPQSLKEEYDALKASSRHHYAERDHLYDLIGMDVVELDKQHIDEIKTIYKVDKKRTDRLKSEIEKLKAENENLKEENKQLKHDISEYEKCIPEHYDIAYPHNIQNIVDEFEATIDGLKTEVLTLEEEKKELQEKVYKFDDHITLLMRWLDDQAGGYAWNDPNKEFIDRHLETSEVVYETDLQADNLKKWYYEIYSIKE